MVDQLTHFATSAKYRKMSLKHHLNRRPTNEVKSTYKHDKPTKNILTNPPHSLPWAFGQNGSQQGVDLLQHIHHFHPTDSPSDTQEEGETCSPEAQFEPTFNSGKRSLGLLGHKLRPPKFCQPPPPKLRPSAPES